MSPTTSSVASTPARPQDRHRIEQQVEPFVRNDLADEDDTPGNAFAHRRWPPGAGEAWRSESSSPSARRSHGAAARARVNSELHTKTSTRGFDNPPPEQTIKRALIRSVAQPRNDADAARAQPEQAPVRCASRSGSPERSTCVARMRRDSRSRSRADAEDLATPSSRTLTGVRRRRVSGYQYGPTDQRRADLLGHRRDPEVLPAVDDAVRRARRCARSDVEHRETSSARRPPTITIWPQQATTRSGTSRHSARARGMPDDTTGRRARGPLSSRHS